jgi:RIO-like serine/threonine protein kinase
MERGVCQQGYVPVFYGCIDQLNPKEWQPDLYMFADDEYPASAIFIEYIPGLEMLELETATKERMAKFVEGLHAIHKAGVLHSDLYSRNMMVDPTKPDKVVWLDFDRARTFDNTKLTERERKFFREEEACMGWFAKSAVCTSTLTYSFRELSLTSTASGSRKRRSNG